MVATTIVAVAFVLGMIAGASIMKLYYENYEDEDM